MIKYFAPTKMIYGQGALISLKEFFTKDDRIAIITDKVLVGNGVVKKATDVLDSIPVFYTIFQDVTPSPDEETVNQAVELARAERCNAVIAIGGGSPMDVSKMVALLMTNPGTLQEYQWEFKQPVAPIAKLITIPTTSGSGSEVGRVAVIISRGQKSGIGRDSLFPTAAILDPEMTRSMPPHITSTTGIDAFTHAYEAYVGASANPISDAFAWEAMQLVVDYLPRAYTNGDDLEARTKMGLAAAIAVIAKDNAGLGCVHACTDAMGVRYHIAHGLANAVFLPYVMEYNMIATLDKHAKLGEIFGLDTANMSKREAAQAALEALKQFLADLDIPEDLAEYFGEDEDIPVFVKTAMGLFTMRNNTRKPRPAELAELYKIVFKRR